MYAANILSMIHCLPPDVYKRQAPSAKPYFKGSYVSPESDATDERNQKELNFSLDEARVIAEINPHTFQPGSPDPAPDS